MRIIRTNYGIKLFLNDETFALVVGKRCTVIESPMALFKRIRRKLPSFWAVGTHDCDSGGRIFAWTPAFTWSDKAARSSWGDGPDTWSRISFKQYLKLRFGDRK